MTPSRRHLFAILGVVLPAVAAAPAFAATSSPIHHKSSKTHAASHKAPKSHHHPSVHQASHHAPHHSTAHKPVSS